MFTGIIEGQGKITQIKPQEQGKRIFITTDFKLEGAKIGDSIAVNGACLTAVTLADHSFEADVSPETVSKTTFNNIKIGDNVNIERALRFSDRLDGHLVSGHIDGVGKIKGRKKAGNAVIINIEVTGALSRYIIQKGSIAVDGVSLTINKRVKNSFEVSIIPHTSKITTIAVKKPGDPVNIETDMIGKYVERFLNQSDNKETDRKPIDMEFLAESGFL